MNNWDSGTWRKWRELVERQRSSGLSVAAFCARNGVAVSSLYVWRRRITSPRTSRAFVEAKVVDAPAPPGPAGAIEIRVRGGRRLRVRRDGFDRELLLDVVAALESLPRGSEAAS